MDDLAIVSENQLERVETLMGKLKDFGMLVGLRLIIIRQKC